MAGRLVGPPPAPTASRATAAVRIRASHAAGR